MKAIAVDQFGGTEELKFRDIPDPQAGEGQVVVAIKAIGVNPVDTYIRAGWYGPRTFPYTPGMDAAGVIESVGPGVTNVLPGDRVYVYGSISGTYAQKCLCKSVRVTRLSEKLSFDQGAALGVPYGTAMRALVHRASSRAGETVLVHGASGGVGLACVQLARSFGLTVFGTAGSDAGLKLVKEQGADHVYDHRDPSHFQQIMDQTRGRGIDIILEMLANVNLQNDLPILAPHGRVIIIGNRGRIEIDPRETMKKDSDIRGMSLLNASDEELVRIHAQVRLGLEGGMLKPVIGRRFALSQAAEAHKAVLESGALGKIILDPT